MKWNSKKSNTTGLYFVRVFKLSTSSKENVFISSTISRFWTISHSKFTVAFVLLLLFISICINTTTLSAATSSAATSCSNSTFLATSFCNTLASEEFSCNLPTSSCNFITTSSWYFSWGEGDSLGRMINIPIHILIRFQCCTLCE